MTDETITITSRCLCKAHVFTTPVKKSALPLRCLLCHCNSCRHKTGSLYLSDVPWPDPGVDLSSLKNYAFSEALIDYFCGTCFTPLFARDIPGGETSANSGTLDNLPGLVEYSGHIFVGDTLDGGATMWLRHSYRDGRPLPRWTGYDDTRVSHAASLHMSWPGASNLPDLKETVAPGTTPLYCHCRGVSLVVRSAADRASWPKEDLPSYIDPTTYKYLAATCVCDSCRISVGTDLVSWATIPLSHIEFPSGEKLPATVSALREAVDNEDPRLGTMTYFKSSPDVERYSCSHCAAPVFYAVHDRPDTLDLAVGLLDHPSGARAEGLLCWSSGTTGFNQDIAGGWREGLAAAARKESEEWRAERGYPKECHGFDTTI